MIKHKLNQEMFDTNYDYLIACLNEEGTFLGSEQFKAVLYAMDGMTKYYKTKSEAIRLASKKHGVTQVFVKEYIDKLGIISIRQIQNKERRREADHKEILLNHKFNTKMEFEDLKEKSSGE